MTEAPVKLSEFLKSQRSSRPCWCLKAAPEVVAQVDAAIKAGSVQWAAMARWLSTQPGALAVSRYLLARHKEQGHHEH